MNGAITMKEAEPIIAVLCSPRSGEAKRRTFLLALATIYDDDNVAEPSARVILNGVRYLRRRLPEGTGELFEVADAEK